MKAPVRWVRRTLTRSLHPGRQRRALQTLAEAAPVRSILFICLGNVCRSPYAEYSFRATLAGRGHGGVSVDSAGFIGPGRPSPEEAQATARLRGLDLTDHVSKVVTTGLADEADLVVVMEPGQVSELRRRTGTRTPILVLGDLDPLKPDRRAIQDPWGRTPEEFQASFDRVDRCMARVMPFLAQAS